MKFEILFRDGPCALQTASREMGEVPDATTRCGNSTYVLASRIEDVTGSNYGKVVVYVLLGGRYAGSITIQGETDVFRSWSHLHKALNNSVGRARVRIASSGRRIRRAVR